MEVNYTSYTGLCNFPRIKVWTAALALQSGAAQKKAGLPPPFSVLALVPMVKPHL
jgi:hypothetical protein